MTCCRSSNNLLQEKSMDYKEYEEIELRSLCVLLLRSMKKIIAIALIAAIIGAAIGAGLGVVSHEKYKASYGAEGSIFLNCENHSIDSDMVDSCVAVFSTGAVLDKVAVETGLTRNSVEGKLTVDVIDGCVLSVKVEGLESEEEALELAGSVIKNGCTAVSEAADHISCLVLDGARSSANPARSLKSWLVKCAVIGAVAAAAAAVIAFVMWAVLGEIFSSRIKDEAMAETVIGLPVLGVIPELEEDRKEKDCAFRTLSASEDYGKAFASLRSRLLVSSAETRLMLVTSALSGEDEYNLAVNLARSMAAAGRRTLLVDGNMRGGELLRCLGISSSKGLKDILSGDAQPEECMLNAGDGLTAVLSGDEVEDPSALLLGGKMAEFAEKVRGSFDIIIVVAPPVGENSDAIALGAVCDAVILAARHRHLSADTVSFAARQLEGAGIKVMGTVITRLDVNKVYSRGGYAQLLRRK